MAPENLDARPARALAELALITCLAALGCGCGETSSPSEPRNGPASAPAQDADDDSTDDLDALRALGYAAVAEDIADASQSGVQIYERERSYPGYNLYCSRNFKEATLFDATGEVLRTWQGTGEGVWDRVVLLPGGDLLVVEIRLTNAESKDYKTEQRFCRRLNWDNQAVWSLPINAHHDVALTPDGGLMLLSFDFRREAEIDPDVDFRDDKIVLLSLDGEVLEEKSLFDMLSANPDAFEFGTVAPKLHRGKHMIDLTHANSLDWMDIEELEGTAPIYSPSNVLVSMRHQDSIAILDWDTGQVVWSWGRGEVVGQHDAQFLDNGHILVFDNGLGRGWSRVIELDPLTSEIVWEFRTPNREDFYSPSRGSNQRLPNGNTLITSSGQGWAFEVTPAKDLVWSFLNPRLVENRRATMVRLYRYPPELVSTVIDR